MAYVPQPTARALYAESLSRSADVAMSHTSSAARRTPLGGSSPCRAHPWAGQAHRLTFRKPALVSHYSVAASCWTKISSPIGTAGGTQILNVTRSRRQQPSIGAGRHLPGDCPCRAATEDNHAEHLPGEQMGELSATTRNITPRQQCPRAPAESQSLTRGSLRESSPGCAGCGGPRSPAPARHARRRGTPRGRRAADRGASGR